MNQDFIRLQDDSKQHEQEQAYSDYNENEALRQLAHMNNIFDF